MKIGSIISLFGLVTSLSFSTLARANQQLCPSGKGIKNAIRNKKLVQFNGEARHLYYDNESINAK